MIANLISHNVYLSIYIHVQFVKKIYETIFTQTHIGQPDPRPECQQQSTRVPATTRAPRPTTTRKPRPTTTRRPETTPRPTTTGRPVTTKKPVLCYPGELYIVPIRFF